ncbi:MAG: 5-formyltetrahydrofolate cyclo-ligase [Tyzzerella sp.]|nr:5-formyltetrahydrofolate cyclo-ligase [Tyzzerella sp.]
MESKKDIRKRVLTKRSNIEEKEWEEKSRRIYEKVVTHPFFLNAEEIYCYVDYKREVSTQKILETAWKLKKKAAVPKITGEDMEFFYIHNFAGLESGYCQILEPTSKELAQGKNVLVVMPGAVFDRNRNRIGYGKGFYDRYLEKHPSYHTMALAFELQMIDSIPADVHDIRPEVIITEEDLYV